jgi:hypothetical protein
MMMTMGRRRREREHNCVQEEEENKVRKIKNTYFGNEVETLCTKKKNHSGAAKPRKFTIQKK